jgi:phage N-6-adenine-methyltransferase
VTIARKQAGTRSNWATPQWLFDHYTDRFRFTLDAAAEAWNAKCAAFITEEQDALKTSWSGRVWLNPPYHDLNPWLRTAHIEAHITRNAELVCMLLPVRTSTLWFQEFVLPFAHVEWLPHRVCFDPPPTWTGKKDSPAEDSMVVVFERPWMPKGRKLQRVE